MEILVVVAELEDKKLKGALIREDHDFTNEVVDAAYSGFSGVMKFLQKSKGEGTQSTTEKAILSTENMADLEKREPKPSAIFQSPFVTDFGSLEHVPAVKRKKNTLEIVKGTIPFHKENGKNATTEETHAYNDWDFEGYKPNTKKKIMHSGTINILVTTTDSIFYKVVRTTYESYLANGSNVINQESIIAKYMSGQSLSCSVPWYYLDHVAIPAHVTDEVHYILAHFNIRERCLVVYNSMTLKVNKEPVHKTVTTFSVLIPLFMECIGFYNTRADIDFNQGPYAVASDCGAFVIAFADHINHDTINGIFPKLNIANYRDDLVVCLYHHAKKKQEEGYKTDVEEPEKARENKEED
uniref:Ubiquitin-like protease family profile domain-containing protein n=1 Tax=Cannabis sativa TaxID=3483 RepID=A0A803Q854_CANSA